MTEITQKIRNQSRTIQQDKRVFEDAVIGAALLDPGCLPRVIDLLETKNFTGVNSEIWHYILQLFGKKPIDLKTVYYQLIQNNDMDTNAIALLLSDKVSKVNSAANIEVHALTILEMDIATKFYDIITSHKATEENKVFEAIIAEVLDALYQDKDKLKTLDHALAYMETVDPNHELTIKVRNFHSGIQAKADKILKRERIRLSLDVLKSLHEGSGCERAISEATNLLISIINNRSVPLGFADEIIRLKNMVSQHNEK